MNTVYKLLAAAKGRPGEKVEILGMKQNVAPLCHLKYDQVRDIQLNFRYFSGVRDSNKQLQFLNYESE